MAFATGAYLLWGLFPLYFKAVAAIPAAEMLAYRILWSLLFLCVITVAGRRWTPVVRALGSKHLLAVLALSAVLIAVNWGVFIWAVAAGRVLECSLGYFITPLLSVFMGVVVLRERLRVLQWIAVVIAGAGVAGQVVALGSMPWVAVSLATSFAGYGLVRKIVPIDALSGLVIESILLTPLALVWLTWIGSHDGIALLSADWRLDLLIVASGPITALPLILFVAGARRIRLASLGLLQYITPTCHFLLALLVFAEPATWPGVLVFPVIWAALAVYTIDMLGLGRGRQRGRTSG